MLALAFAVSLCHNCAASSFLTTRRASHYALLVIASRVSQTHVGIYNTETQSRNGDNHAVMMNVGGVALPLLRSVVFSYHASRFLPRVVFSYHASRFLPRVVLLITRCWFLLRECHRHMWEFTTQKRNRAAVTIAQRRRFLPRVVFLTTPWWLVLRDCQTAFGLSTGAVTTRIV